MLNIFKSPSPKQKQQTLPINTDNVLIKQFNNLNIEIYGTHEDPLFKAKDIGDLLGIKNIRDTVLKLDEQCKVKINTPNGGVGYKTNVGTTDVGYKSDTWFLTEDGLYELLFISRKPIAKRTVIKEIRLKGKYDLEEQLKQKELALYEKEIETQQLLQLKEQELQSKEQELVHYKQKTYEEIEKTSHVYVIKTDGGYKVGKTKDINNRVKGLQTGNVNNLEVILDYKTSNADLLERAVHYILDRYRCNSNREFFDCEIQYIKNTVTILGNTIDTLKSCYQHISNDELTNKLQENVGIVISESQTKSIELNLQSESSVKLIEDKDEFFDWMQDNVIEKRNGILNLKDVCELYLNKSNIPSRISNKFRLEVEKYIKRVYPRMSCQYKDTTYNCVKVRGWIGLVIKNN